MKVHHPYQYKKQYLQRSCTGPASAHPLDYHLKVLNAKGYRNKVFSDYVSYQFDFIFEPAYFGTITWFPFVYHFEDVEKESRHFRNKLMASILGCGASKIPQLPNRPRILFFQEVKSIIVNPKSKEPKWKQTFHTHFHLEDWNTVSDIHHLNELVQTQVRPRFHRLQRTDTAENKAIVIKPWVAQQHASYNIKDFYSRQYCQDGDLIIDYRNSDLG